VARSSGTSSGPSPSAERASGGEAPLAGGAVRIHLTGAGLLAIVLVLAAGIVAVNSGNNLLYLVVASLLALFALSGVLGHLNLAGLGLRLLPPEEAWAGRPVSVRALLVSRRARRAAFLLSLSGERAGVRPTVIEIPPGDQAPVELTLLFPARGLQPWPEQEVSSEFPFGLIRRGRRVSPPGRVLVYPRPIPVPWECVDRAEREGELAVRRAPGAGGDYRGLREYVPGDTISRVQWTSWLRLRRLQTKEFEAEGAPPVVYAFDAVPGPGTEERLGQLAWLVRTATRRDRSVGLELPGLTLPPGTGTAHRRRLLAALARFGDAS
jgi:uncharacterized protein (DUF58 family)